MNCRSAALLLLAFALSPAWGVEPGAPAPEQAALPDGVEMLPFDQVDSFTVSPKGGLAAHIQKDGIVLVWDTTSYKVQQAIPAQEQADVMAKALAFSPDGKLLAIGYNNARLVIWSLAERKAITGFAVSDNPKDAVTALVFSPNGRILAVGADNHTTTLWEPASQKLLHTFDVGYGGDLGDPGTPIAVNFSGDGDRLIVDEWYEGHYDVDRGHVIWDIKTGIEIPTGKEVAAIYMQRGNAIGSNGKILVYTGKKGLVVASLDSCSELNHLPFGTAVETVAVDPQGRWLAASNETQEGNEITFSGLNGQELSKVTLPPKWLHDLVPLQDGRSLLALMSAPSQNELSLHLYRIAVPKTLLQLPPPTAPRNTDACQPPDVEKHLVLPDTIKPLVPLETSHAQAGAPAYQVVVPAYEDSENEAREATSQLPSPTDHALPVLQLKDTGNIDSYLVKKNQMTVLFSDGTIRIWQITPVAGHKLKGIEVSSTGCGDPALVHDVSWDGRYALVMSAGCELSTPDEIYDTSTGKSVDTGAGAFISPFAAHSNRVITEPNRPNHLQVIDLDKGGEVVTYFPRQVTQHTDYALLATISDDGRLVANALADGRVRIWDIDARQLVGEAQVADEVTALAFDADTHHLRVSLKNTQDMVFDADASAQSTATPTESSTNKTLDSRLTGASQE